MNERGQGGKPLITVGRAPGSGIMGDGAIDGRGGAKHLGENASWCDLGRTAKVMQLSQSLPRLTVEVQAVSLADRFEDAIRQIVAARIVEGDFCARDV